MLFFKPCAYIDYVPCKLSEGDVWFIYYYVKDPETGRLKRIRKKINRIRPVKERRKAANVLMAEINHRLALGWNPLLELKAPQADTRLFDAFDAFLTIKAKEMEHDSLRSYRSFIKTFRTWLEKRGLDGNAYCSAVTRTVAATFMDGFETKLSAKTYNNYVAFYRARRNHS